MIIFEYIKVLFKTIIESWESTKEWDKRMCVFTKGVRHKSNKSISEALFKNDKMDLDNWKYKFICENPNDNF